MGKGLGFALNWDRDHALVFIVQMLEIETLESLVGSKILKRLNLGRYLCSVEVFHL